MLKMINASEIILEGLPEMNGILGHKIVESLHLKERSDFLGTCFDVVTSHIHNLDHFNGLFAT